MASENINQSRVLQSNLWQRAIQYVLHFLRSRPKSSGNTTTLMHARLSDHHAPSNPSDNPSAMFSQRLINKDNFFSLSEQELFVLIKQEYAEELERLKTAYSIPGKRDESITTPSPSQILYDEDYDEINRTLVGVRALRWIRARDYKVFVGTQPSSERLKPESFGWICHIFEKGLKDYADDDDFYTLITSMIINDLGKSPTLAEDYAKQTNTDVSKVNHDMILYQVLKDANSPNTTLIPSLGHLAPWQRRDLFLGIKLGSEFNFGQLAQAENVPACLSGLKEMCGLTHAFDMRFMEQLLDIAGSSGHIDHTCAKKLIEPIFDSYYNVYEIAVKIINGEFGLREGYDTILIKKLALLKKAGWTSSLDVKKAPDRALMRLLCIGGASTAETASLYQNTFQGLPQKVYASLVHNLNIDGSIEEPAIQPTYIPAMCALAMSSTKNGTREEKSKALSAVLTYLSRVLTLTPERKSHLPQGVTVVEREVRTLMQGTLKTEMFKEDPESALATLDIPEDELAKMAEGYDWTFEDTKPTS